MLIKYHKSFFLLLITIFFMTGCNGSDTARWTEEVKSWNGSVFQLEGRGEIGSSGWPTAHRGAIRYVEYHHRSTQAYWKSSGEYQPIIFDLVNGVPYVVIVISNDFECYMTNYPEQGLLIYKWNISNGWQSVKAENLPPKFEFNLMEQMFNTRDKSRDVKGFVSLSTKVIREGGDRIGDFKKWKDSYGSECEKQKRLGGTWKTDAKVPNYLGFHGKPNF
jgi:hypothetical protein